MLEKKDNFTFVRESLSEAEIIKLEAANNDPLLIEALRKVVLHQIYHQGVLKKGHFADQNLNFILRGVQNALAENKKLEDIGGELVANFIACQLVDLGFNTILKFKKVEPPPPPKENDAE